MLTLLRRSQDFFASDYAAARAKFVGACQRRGIAVSEYRHPLVGPDGETLAVDVARLGPANASKLLMIISGTHGVEGLAGAGCQVAIVDDAEIAVPQDTAILLVHMLNPWGCAWGRRQTEANVDLNRNFLDFTHPLPRNDLYAKAHPIVMSGSAGTRARVDPQLRAFRESAGIEALSHALFGGQYTHGDGIGFGGDQPTWSFDTMKTIVRDHVRSVRNVGVIDLHTGLGPFGYGVLMSLEEPGSSDFTRARAWYGPGVVHVANASSMPYLPAGTIIGWASRAFAAETTAVALEFGTFELDKLLDLQVDDCRVRVGESDGSHLQALVRQEMVDFFYPATPDWLQSVTLRFFQCVQLALDGLDRAGAPGRSILAEA